MLPFVAISMVGLLGITAIAVDISAGNRQRRIAQTAVDAAAVAGGTEIYRGRDSAAVVNAATAVFALNFAAESSDTLVVIYPATSSDTRFNNNKGFVEVRLSTKSSAIFGRIWNATNFVVKARAVAGLEAINSNCVISLADAGLGIDIPGDMDTDCGVVSNASINVKKTLTAPYVGAVGSVSGGGDNVETGIPPSPDPLAALPIPAFDGTCEYTNLNVSSDVTLDPGDYCGGLTVGKNKRATLRPGTYVMRGGGITAGEIEAWNGVTIINTVSLDNDPAKFKPIVFGNSCHFHIQAPSTGTYKGIAVFQDPAAPSASSSSEQVNELCGKGTNSKCDANDPDIEGTVYLPTQTFDLGNSNGKLTIKGVLLAKFITGQNGGGKFCNFLGSFGNSAIKRLSLVE
jgi:hypothetical protein